jgi:hypothetical protein
MAAVLHDPRDPDLITHRLVDLLRQRVYGIVHGYEDLNDHERLREDVLLQSVLDRKAALDSAPRLWRMENRIKEAQLGLFADRTLCHYFIANQFRLLLSSLAYILVERLRTLALAAPRSPGCRPAPCAPSSSRSAPRSSATPQIPVKHAG